MTAQRTSFTMKPEPAQDPQALADPDEPDRDQRDRQQHQRSTRRSMSTSGWHASADGRTRTPEKRRAGRMWVTPTAERMLEGDRPARPRTRSSSSGGRDPAFLETDPWRALRILSEFVEGFDALAQVGPAITVFGSARTAPGDPTLRARPRRSAAGSPRPASRSSPAVAPG